MKNLFTLSILSLFVGSFSFAQVVEDYQKKCATYTQMDEFFKIHPELEHHYYAQELLQNSLVVNSEGKTNDSTYIIPVVVHIIHEYGAEHIDDQKAYDLMTALNREFNAQDADSVDLVPEYENLHGNANIEFRLAAIDPFGNCTNGIEHIYSHETRVGDAYSKLNQWNRAKYLNIWAVDIVGTPGAAAYATPPASTDGSGFWVDGVLSQYSHVVGTGWNESVITHEVGHYFNLKHVWGDLDLINNPPSVCGDDGVDDTPQTMGWLSPCPMGTYPNGWIVCGPNTLPILESTFDFDSIVPTSGMTDPTPIPIPQVNLTDPNISAVYSNFTAVGVGANPTTTGTFGFDSWDTGAADGETVYANLTGSINTAKYYEFSVAPESRGRLNLDTLVFQVARDTEGPRTFAVRWDIDGYAANLDLTAASSTNTDITVDDVADIFFYTYDSTYLEGGFGVDLMATEIDPTNPVTFRIYAWNAESATGDFIVDNVRIAGSVGLVEDVQNYMEYSYCDRHFTPGQVDRMHNALNGIAGQRSILWQDTTLLSTGILDYVYINESGDTIQKIDGLLQLPQSPSNDFNNLTVPLCTPVADFWTDDKTICKGTIVTFTDESWNAVVGSRQWDFDGGNASSTTNSTVNVSWDTEGWKTITLTVTNARGSDTKVAQNYIYVGPDWADYVGPTSFDMEGANGGNFFIVQNPEDNHGKFALIDNYGYNGSQAWKLGNYKDVSNADPYTNDFFYNARLGLSMDRLITPSINLANTTGVTVTFKFAYATNATDPADITETLKVYSSRNCGESWTPRIVSVDGTVAGSTVSGDDIVTAGFASNADFNPTNNLQWAEGSFTYTTNSTDTKTRFAFEFVASDVASNLFIDDINITGVLGLSDDVIASMDLQVYPNPTNGEAINVSYMAQNEPTEFILRDVQGKIIATQVIEATNAQVNAELKGTANLAASYYFLEVRTGESTTTKKVVVL